MRMNNVELGSVAGAATSIGAATVMTISDWAIMVGIATAILTFLLNVWCSRRREEREQRQAEQQAMLMAQQARVAALAEKESIARLAALGLKP